MAMTATSYEDQSAYTLSAYINLVVFSVVFVALRVFVKVKIVRIWGYEDYAILFALLCNIVAMVFLFREEQISKGNYDIYKAIFATDLPERLKFFYAINIAGNLSVLFVKISFLLLYLRLFHQRNIRIAIYIVSAIVLVYGTWALVTNIFICWPIDSFWNAIVPFESDRCLNVYKTFISQCGLNSGTDVLILLLPLPGLRHLMLPRGQRVALVLVFSLGIFICIASILRMLSFIRAFGDGTYNLVWGGRSIGIWSAIETNVAIICACLPPLRPLIMRLLALRSRLRTGVELGHTYISDKFGSSGDNHNNNINNNNNHNYHRDHYGSGDAAGIYGAGRRLWLEKWQRSRTSGTKSRTNNASGGTNTFITRQGRSSGSIRSDLDQCDHDVDVEDDDASLSSLDPTLSGSKTSKISKVPKCKHKICVTTVHTVEYEPGDGAIAHANANAYVHTSTNASATANPNANAGQWYQGRGYGWSGDFV